MKDFNNFLKSVDIENVELSSKKIEKTDNIFAYQQSINVSITIELLRQYHEWLNQ